MGAFTGISADVFEPPLNPNHRSFFTITPFGHWQD
jgi:hypothetical protein